MEKNMETTILSWGIGSRVRVFIRKPGLLDCFFSGCWGYKIFSAVSRMRGAPRILAHYMSHSLNSWYPT